MIPADARRARSLQLVGGWARSDRAFPPTDVFGRSRAVGRWSPRTCARQQRWVLSTQRDRAGSRAWFAGTSSTGPNDPGPGVSS